MKVVFAGARSLELEQVAGHLLQQLASLPDKTTVLLRGRAYEEPGAFEQLVAQLCATMDIETEWRVSTGSGREGTMFRDINMVEAADAVVCYFHPDEVMEGGTAHVAEKALDQDKPLYAYTYDDGVHWVGGIEPLGLESLGKVRSASHSTAR